VDEPAVEDLAVNVTTPEVSDAPDAAEIVSVAPRLEVSVTVSPETGLPFASSRVTVSVEVLVPSAIGDAGEATKVDRTALTGPATKST
jgi:hypothetical protein